MINKTNLEKKEETKMKKEETEKASSQHFHPNILEMFHNTCKIIVTEDLPTPEFNLCVNTIHNTLTYLKASRKNDNKADDDLDSKIKEKK